MPLVLTETPVRPTPLDPPRKRWTRAECSALEATGAFDTTRLELVEGELISRMGKHRPHVSFTNRLVFALTRIFGEEFVNSEAPIDVASQDNPSNEPIPDVIVLRRPERELTANPRPYEIALAVEVSDTTLRFDLNTKAALYARAGIADYWVLDINGRRLIVHRDPRDGRYQSVTAYAANESVSPLHAPHASFKLADIL